MKSRWDLNLASLFRRKFMKLPLCSCDVFFVSKIVVFLIKD